MLTRAQEFGVGGDFDVEHWPEGPDGRGRVWRTLLITEPDSVDLRNVGVTERILEEFVHQITGIRPFFVNMPRQSHPTYINFHTHRDMRIASHIIDHNMRIIVNGQFFCDIDSIQEWHTRMDIYEARVLEEQQRELAAQQLAVRQLLIQQPVPPPAPVRAGSLFRAREQDMQDIENDPQHGESDADAEPWPRAREDVEDSQQHRERENVYVPPWLRRIAVESESVTSTTVEPEPLVSDAASPTPYQAQTEVPASSPITPSPIQTTAATVPIFEASGPRARSSSKTFNRRSIESDSAKEISPLQQRIQPRASSFHSVNRWADIDTDSDDD